VKIFVTGASGFVSGAAVSQLRNDHQIFAMSRSEESDGKIRNLGVEPVRSALVDETYPLATNSPFPYSKTKALAEIAVNDAIRCVYHVPGLYFER
jgi:nucleoside-diphosphate-sugar epimerase